MDVEFWIIFIFFTLLNLVLFRWKNKGYEIVVIHMMLMILSFVLGATLMIQYNAVLTIVFCLISIVTFFGTLFTTKVVNS